MTPFTIVLSKTGTSKITELVINYVNEKYLRQLYEEKSKSILDFEYKFLLVIYFADYFNYQVSNGYFSQLIFNSKGVYNQYFIEALGELGADKQLEAFKKAVEVFDNFTAENKNQFFDSEYFGENNLRDNIDGVLDSEDYYEIQPELKNLISEYTEHHLIEVSKLLGLPDWQVELLTTINACHKKISKYESDFETVENDQYEKRFGEKEKRALFSRIVEKIKLELDTWENDIYWSFVSREIDRTDGRFYGPLGFALATENLFNSLIVPALSHINAPETASRISKVTQLAETEEYLQHQQSVKGIGKDKKPSEEFFNQLEMQLGGSLFSPDENIVDLMKIYMEKVSPKT